MKKTFALTLAAAAATCMLSCNNGKVYDNYEHTPIAGWEKNDTLSFDIPRVKDKGLYTLELGLRINESYPFMGLTLIVEQQKHPDGTAHIDTLRCKLTDTEGNSEGQGINYYQYTFDVSDMELAKGDSLHVCVRHDMKREILPGISDIGIVLRRK